MKRIDLLYGEASGIYIFFKCNKVQKYYKKDIENLHMCSNCLTLHIMEAYNHVEYKEQEYIAPASSVSVRNNYYISDFGKEYDKLRQEEN